MTSSDHPDLHQAASPSKPDQALPGFSQASSLPPPLPEGVKPLPSPLPATPRDAAGGGGSGLAFLALLVALAALAQPWVLRRYEMRHPVEAVTTVTPGAPLPQDQSPPVAETATPPASPPVAAAAEDNPPQPSTQAAVPPPAPPPPTAADAASSELQARLGSLQTALAAQGAAIEQLRAGQQNLPDPSSLRLFVAGQQIRLALALGRPYEAQLKTIEQLLPKKNISDEERSDIVTPLEWGAITGMPTLEQLSARYDMLAPSLIREIRMNEATDPWSRFLAAVRNIFLIRHTATLPNGNDSSAPESAVDRVMTALKAHNLAAARDAANALPAAVHDLIAAWKSDADRLFDASQALDRLDALTVTSMDQTAL